MTPQEVLVGKILEKLSQGIIPWRKSWSVNDRAVNWTTQKAYRGINSLLLEGGEYATMNQISAAGGKVIKGSKGHPVAFFKWMQNEEADDNKGFPLLRYYTVFEINTQCEGLKSKRKVKETTVTPIEQAEKLIEGYATIPQITHGSPSYNPSKDLLMMPDMNEFTTEQEYYATMFHEMTHSTGHKNRLNRPAVVDTIHFGSEKYSKEELVAEIGAAMLCGTVGIENTLDNSVAYIQSWMKKLQDDPKIIISAASQAQKATDYIQGIKVQED